MTEENLQEALKKFEALVREQSERSDRIKAQKDSIDYDKLDKIVIGVCGGDGIGPIITKESARVLEYMLEDDVKAGKLSLKSSTDLQSKTELPICRLFRTMFWKSLNHVTLF